MENIYSILNKLSEKEVFNSDTLSVYSIQELLKDKEITGMLDNFFSANQKFNMDDIEKITSNKNVRDFIEFYLNERGLLNDNESLNIDDVHLSSHYRDYLIDISKYSVLPKEREKTLFEEYNNTKSAARKKETRDELIKHNLRLVARVAGSYKGIGIDIMDLIEDGNLGLLTAIDKFDVTKGYKFSTYAMWWIRQSIHRKGNDESDLIRKPAHYKEKYLKFQTLKKDYYDKYHTELIVNDSNIDDIAKDLGSSPDMVMQFIGESTPVSLSTPVNYENGGESVIGDFIRDKDTNIEESVVQNEIFKELVSALENSHLTDQEKDIIKRRCGFFGEEQTLEEIGEVYNLTRERIRQIENKGLTKLRRDKNIRGIGESLGEEQNPKVKAFRR